MSDHKLKKQFQWDEIPSPDGDNGVPPGVHRACRRKRPRVKATIPVGRCMTRSTCAGNDVRVTVGKEGLVGNARVDGGAGGAGNRELFAPSLDS